MNERSEQTNVNSTSVESIVMRPYDAIIKSRQGKGGMAMGKHKAANAVCCERIVGQLEAAGMLEERDWAVWMLWWRTMDWQTQQQVQEMQQEEINQLSKRVDDLEREFDRF